MNFVEVTVKLIENPREVFIDSERCVYRVNTLLAAAGSKKAPTPLEINLWGDSGRRMYANAKEGDLVLLHGGKLKHDLQNRRHWINGGTICPVTESFPVFNTVILGGQCIKRIDPENSRECKTTKDGLMIVNQSLSVRGSSRDGNDLFNLVAINRTEDRVQLARLIMDYTSKGSGLTVHGKLVTSEWNDAESGATRSKTEVQVKEVTLAPKPKTEERPIKSQSSISNGEEVKSLWNAGGSTGSWAAEPENAGVGAAVGDSNYPPF